MAKTCFETNFENLHFNDRAQTDLDRNVQCDFIQEPSKITWKEYLGFDTESENIYWLTTKRDGKKALSKTEYKIKNLNINATYLKNKKKAQARALGSGGESADVIIRTNQHNNLVVRLISDTCVYYKSHLKPNGERIKLGEEVEVFCHEKIFEELLERQDIDFDPSEAKLIFGKSTKQEVTITIRSRAANALFVSLIQDPFSGLYATL